MVNKLQLRALPPPTATCPPPINNHHHPPPQNPNPNPISIMDDPTAAAISATPPPAQNPTPPQSPSPSASGSSSPNNLELVPITTRSGATATATKKTPPLPWTDQETVSLIQTYQEKWYSLKKGQLKASQWEDVANAVAARCGHDVPSKTSTQCRHKIEKLRKRYREERLKPYNSWQYFDLMDDMERGPMPLKAQPMSVRFQSPGEDEEANFGSANAKKKPKVRSMKILKGDHDVGYYGNINRKPKMVKEVGDDESVRVTRGLRTPVIQQQKGYFQNEVSDPENEDYGGEEEGDGEEEMEGAVGKRGRGGNVVKELAAEIRGFAERFMRMESRKLEAMRENERFRMEMEQKRMDKILESHRKVVDTIEQAFQGARKKAKRPQET